MEYRLVSRRRILQAATAGVAVALVPMGSWGLGGVPYVTPDVKVYAVIVNKHGLTDEEFHAHWREPHVRLTKKVSQIKRYLQNHAPGPTPSELQPMPTRALLLLKRKADVSPLDFRADVATVAASLPTAGNVGSITFALPTEAAYPGDAKPPFDAVIEIGFDSDAAYKAIWARHGPALLRRLRRYADIPASRGFLAHEERVIWPPFNL